MARLNDAIDNVMNEARMLVLGGQVFLGAGFSACFESRFDALPLPARQMELTFLVVMSTGLCWLLWPSAFHQIAHGGQLKAEVHGFSTTILDWGLLPFVAGIGLNFYPVAVALDATHPVIIAAASSLLSFLAWYVLGFMNAASGRRERFAEKLRQEEEENERQQKPDLSERIKKLLIECRVALPGAQAFIGFQGAIVFTESFQKIPKGAQWTHFASMCFMLMAITLFIAPAAYHRIAEAGEDSERFFRVGQWMLLGGLFFLAPGMALDLWVLVRKITKSVTTATWAAAILLFAAYVLWFGYSALHRHRTRD